MRGHRPVSAGAPLPAAALAAILALSAERTPAHAQLQAAPTLLEIAANASSTRMILRNPGTTSVAAQIRVFAWSQRDGEDQLEPSEELVVSPPILEVPAQGEHVVRIVRLGPPAERTDRSYRVVVDELPRDEAPGTSRVGLRMRYVLPAFVRAPDAVPASLSCRLEVDDLRLTCENEGGRAAQLGATALLDEDGRSVPLSEGLFGYVLAGSRRVWQVPEDSIDLVGHPLRLETRLDGEPATIPVERLR